MYYCIVLSSLPTDSSLFFQISHLSHKQGKFQYRQDSGRSKRRLVRRGGRGCSMFTSSGRTGCPLQTDGLPVWGHLAGCCPGRPGWQKGGVVLSVVRRTSWGRWTHSRVRWFWLCTPSCWASLWVLTQNGFGWIRDNIHDTTWLITLVMAWLWLIY